MSSRCAVSVGRVASFAENERVISMCNIMSRSYLRSNSAIVRLPRRRAVVLLEVVISLGILILAMGVIGLAFNNGNYRIHRAEEQIQALIMTERLIAEMDTKILDLEEITEGSGESGSFGEESIEGLSWRVEVEPSQRVEGLLKIDFFIYVGDPDDDQERHFVMHTRVFRPEPRGIDFERDFGLDEDQIQVLMDAIPGGEAVLDPNNFDPRSLAQLPLDDLIELLPTMIQAFGGNLGGLQMDQIIQAVESGDTQALQDIAGQHGGGIGPQSGGQR